MIHVYHFLMLKNKNGCVKMNVLKKQEIHTVEKQVMIKFLKFKVYFINILYF